MGILKLFKDWRELEKRIRRSFGKRDKITQENKIEIAQLKGAVETLMKVQRKSKTSLRQVQEKTLIHRLRQARKEQAKQQILEFVKQKIPIPSIKIKVMSKLGISKASFYNYVNELITEGSLSPSLRQRHRLRLLDK